MEVFDRGSCSKLDDRRLMKNKKKADLQSVASSRADDADKTPGNHHTIN